MMRDEGQVVAEKRCLSIWGLLNRQNGQSMLELAILLPVVTLVCCYAVDIAYFLIVVASLSSSARNAVEYSIQGASSPTASTLPEADPAKSTKSVVGVALGEIANFAQSATVTAVQVCSPKVGTSALNAPLCAGFGGSAAIYTPDIDPEPALFQLNRVDVTYTIQPPIPLTIFSTNLLPSPTIHRMAEMRVVN